MALAAFGDPNLPITDRIVAAQSSILTATLCAFVLAALFAQQRRNEAALNDNRQRLQLALDASGLGVWSVDLTTGRVEIDSRGKLLHGLDANTRLLTIEEARQVVHPDDLAHLRAVFGAPQPFTPVRSGEYRVVIPASHPHAGEVRYVATVGRLADDSKRWHGVVRDITEHKAAEAAVKESEARLREALTAGQVMAFEWSPRTGLSLRSENSSQILGIELRQEANRGLNDFLARVHPDDRAHFKAHVYGVCPARPSYSTRFRFIRRDGREVWLEETAKAEFDAAGHYVRLKGLTRDVTERKRAEEHQNLLIAELDHRVKNVLANVAAVAMRTREGSGSMDEFVAALDGRIKSMADAHALLSRSRWQGVSLTDLVRQELAPYATVGNTTVEGPDVVLTTEATQTVAMVLHELATNAAKYGALSTPQGRVSVHWDRRSTASARATLRLEWHEQGGPAVAAPAQTGYGTSVIRELIPYELGGTAELEFAADGVCCTIEITVDSDRVRSGTSSLLPLMSFWRPCLTNAANAD